MRDVGMTTGKALLAMNTISSIELERESFEVS
jgi:hypothetical protein